MNVQAVDPKTQREVLATWEANRIHELEAENARLRWMLRVHTLADKLHLSHGEASFLVALYDAGRTMTGPSILALTPAAWRGAKSHLASMIVSRIRQKLGAETIKTVSAGYQLSDEARAKVQIVLEDAP